MTDSIEVVAIVGSRGFTEVQLVERVIERLIDTHETLTIISGGARGVDTFVRETCRRYGFHFCHEDPDLSGLAHLPLSRHFVEFRADWDKHGKRAGYLRNRDVVRHASRVIALFAPGPNTPGTANVIDMATTAGLPTHVYHEGKWSMPPRQGVR